MQEQGGELVQAPTRALSATAEIERSRAVQEVQAALVVAKKFPRDAIEAERRIIEACQRHSFAEIALFKFPRGGSSVSDVSIRMAEVMAQSWGNLQCGVRELERMEGKSVAESFAWDLETNFKDSKTFEVAHTIDLQGGKKKILIDERDIYEKIANYGARRKRACILAVIPRHVKDAAVAMVRKTLAQGNGEPLIDRIKRVVLGFAAFGVNQEMLEKHLGHQIDLTTGEEIADLQAIYNTIKEGSAKRGDYFDFPNDEPKTGQAAELGQKIKERKASAMPATFNAKDADQYKMVEIALKSKKVDEALWGDIVKALNGKPIASLDAVIAEVFAR